MTEPFRALAIISEPKSVSIYALYPWPLSCKYRNQKVESVFFFFRVSVVILTAISETLQAHNWQHGGQQTHSCCIYKAVYISTKSRLFRWTTKTTALNDVWGVIKSRNSLWAIHSFVPRCLTPCFTHNASYPTQYWGSCCRYVSQQRRHFHGDAVFIILMKAMLPHAVLPPSSPLSVVNSVELITKVDI